MRRTVRRLATAAAVAGAGADDFVNPPAAGLVRAMQTKLRPDRYRTIPPGPETVGHGTTMRPQF